MTSATDPIAAAKNMYGEAYINEKCYNCEPLNFSEMTTPIARIFTVKVTSSYDFPMVDLITTY